MNKRGGRAAKTKYSSPVMLLWTMFTASECVKERVFALSSAYRATAKDKKAGKSHVFTLIKTCSTFFVPLSRSRMERDQIRQSGSSFERVGCYHPEHYHLHFEDMSHFIVWRLKNDWGLSPSILRFLSHLLLHYREMVNLKPSRRSLVCSFVLSFILLPAFLGLSGPVKVLKGVFQPVERALTPHSVQL